MEGLEARQKLRKRKSKEPPLQWQVTTYILLEGEKEAMTMMETTKVHP